MSFSSRRSLSRRTILRGAGAALSLPLLDAMVPAFVPVVKSAGKPIHRFQAVYAPNGMAMEYWTPAAVGSDFELSPILQPLTPFRSQLLVVSGLNSTWHAVHAGASGAFLTGTPRGGKSETDILASTSMDQVLAQESGKATQLASLELSMDHLAHAGECTAGLNCAYTQTISWRSPTMPLPMENNPRAVFERLFGDSGSAEPGPRLARMRERKSILDSVSERLADLRRELGPTDRSKVDEYTEAVRDVERRIQRAEEQTAVELPLVEQPSGAPAVFEDHLRLMFDLQFLALQCDLTRVVTFMLGREQSTRTYPQVGVPDAHHPLSHHQNQPPLIALMSKINTYHVALFSEYVARLRDTPDGDGTLLDHMTILYGSGLSNSTRHAADNLPLVLVGGATGRIKGGRHLKYPGDTPIANLHLTLLDKLDVPVERFGASTAKLDIDTLSGL